MFRKVTAMPDCHAELQLKKNFKETITRHQQLQNAERGCLINTSTLEGVAFFKALKPIPALEDIDFEKDPLLIPQFYCDRIEKLWSARADYPDDSLPYVAPRYGSGIVGAMILGDVTFGSNTSWFEPVGASLDEALEFEWGNENKWIDLVVDGLNYCAKQMDGKSYSFFEGYHSPLEFASMIRGSDIYLEMYTDPEKVHQLLQRCDEALMWLYRLLEGRVEQIGYGVLARSLWMERGVPFLSDDSAGSVSPEFYREFCLPYIDKMFQRYGGGFLHVHTQAYHQMDNLSDMEWLTIYNWRQDPNTSKPSEILDMIIRGAKTKIVEIILTPQQIKQHIDTLSQGRFIIDTECRDQVEQEEIIEFVKQNAPIL